MTSSAQIEDIVRSVYSPNYRGLFPLNSIIMFILIFQLNATFIYCMNNNTCQVNKT